MNKTLWIVLALIAVVACDSSEEILSKVKSKRVRKLLKERQETVDSGLNELEELCSGVTDKLKDAVENFVECAEKVDDSLTICETIQTAALNCTDPFLKVVDECLPARARGLPDLGVKSLVSAADFLCKQTGESLFELLNPCLWEDGEEEAEEEGECSEKTLEARVERYINRTEVPSRSDICGFATDLKGCLHKDGVKECKNQKTRNVAIGLFDAIVAPCSSINEV